ncbi:Cytochrome P450, E-class, group I [Parasponia andersonii]|uniref:Cytochrome P450, E-class, group I n=1 Tax=Parasponia andersonii TaxID=3476 RepID=A0A2P5B5S3_PARAD|nr:Cytochrome P450, E-class, group I [Parasponia andersonii]
MASPFSLSSLSSSPLSPYYHLFFTLLAFLISGLIFLLTQKTKSKRRNLPPGPPGWPIVGNLFQVVRSGKPFFEYVRHLRTQYGPILTLKMGTRTLIILSDPKLVHEALIENGAVFASRPRENPTRNIFSCNKFTVNAAVYGPVWRSLRKNMVQNMLSSSRLREFRGARARAMDRFIERLHAEAKAGDGAVWVLRNARFAVFCILVTMCFGIEMDEGTVERMDQVMKSVLITLDPRIDDFLPVLSSFFSRQRKEALRVRAEQVEFVSRFIEQRRRALASPGSDDSATSFSYLDTLFDLRIEGREDSPPSRDELVTLCSEFLNGGTDTTGTAVEWGIAQLIANPTVQDRIYEEIRSVVGGGGRKIDEKDVEKMPYLEAVVKELLRKHPPTPFSLTHAVTEPTTLAGYDIPTDANVEIFVSGISDDPKIWTNPERFDPTRFLEGGEGEQVQGGGGGIKMMPFGVGRRICPGLNMATVHIHLMLARMVQEFEWSAYPPGTELDFAGKTEFTVVMKNTLRAVIKRRV